jgi:DNA-directed RNA polymerase subunit M/transcription elongation factor TFIIS
MEKEQDQSQEKEQESEQHVDASVDGPVNLEAIKVYIRKRLHNVSAGIFNTQDMDDLIDEMFEISEEFRIGTMNDDDDTEEEIISAVEVYMIIFVKILTFFRNIKVKGNHDFTDNELERIKAIEGELTLKKILSIHIKEIPRAKREYINPEKWKSLHDSRTKSAQIERKVGMHTCQKCGSKYTSHKEMQVASADESMRVSVVCLDCNHHWKF